MNKSIKLLSSVAILGAAFAAMPAQAGMVQDQHGNVGYDTAAECDAAVLAGEAKFYQPVTHKKPFIRSGEVKVQTATLRDLGEQYSRGACDLGTARKGGREGVAKALQGKYVPFSPDMPINVYTDKTGNAVRVTMQQCDNWFSASAPRPVEIPAPVVAEPVAAPVVETPVVEAPVVATPAVAKSFAASPYVFGTIGAWRDGVKGNPQTKVQKEDDIKVAGQAGVGVQFNQYVGAEAFYQGGDKFELANTEVKSEAYGARLTAGLPIGEKANVFAKAGVAEVKHSAVGETAKKTVPTFGLGATYNLTEKLKLRADADHYFFKRSHTDFQCSDYVGVGLQYNF